MHCSIISNKGDVFNADYSKLPYQYMWKSKNKDIAIYILQLVINNNVHKINNLLPPPIYHHHHHIIIHCCKNAQPWWWGPQPNTMPSCFCTDALCNNGHNHKERGDAFSSISPADTGIKCSQNYPFISSKWICGLLRPQSSSKSGNKNQERTLYYTVPINKEIHQS